MTLEDSFPDDPFRSGLSLRSRPAASNHIALDYTGFESSLASGAPFRGTEAFLLSAFEQKLPIYHEDNTSRYVEATTSPAGSSYDHCGLSVEASIAGSFLRASGRGKYETKALANRDVRSIRGHASLCKDSLIEMALCKGNYLFPKDHHLRTDSSVRPSTSIVPRCSRYPTPAVDW